jgi:hypothetical protein
MLCRSIFGIALIASIAFGQQSLPATKVPAFSELKEGDEMIVDLVSTGCWHNTHEIFAFRRAKDSSVSVTVTYIEHIQHGKEPDTLNPIKLGEVKLSEKEFKGLDGLLGFYRSPRSSGCTDKDKITFVFRREGTVVARESFIDASCSYERRDFTWLGHLVDKIFEKSTDKGG